MMDRHFKQLLALVIACGASLAANAQIKVLALTDSATFRPGLPAPGSLGTIFCTGLVGINGVQVATQFPLTSQIAGVSVRVHSVLVPLLAIADFGSYQQINFQVWTGQTAEPNVTVTQGNISGIIPLMAAPAWGVFFTDSMGYAIAQHSDYSLVSREAPAQPGEVVVAYATNVISFAYVLNYPFPGLPAKADPLSTVESIDQNPEVPYFTLDGTKVDTLYSGLTPGAVGVFQVNFRVPDGTPDGDAILNAVTNTVCYNQGQPFGYCDNGKKSIGAKIPIKATAQ